MIYFLYNATHKLAVFKDNREINYRLVQVNVYEFIKSYQSQNYEMII